MKAQELAQKDIARARAEPPTSFTVQPRSIETVYDGYRFRSRLEARWAVFFNAAGIKYEYEAQGYTLSDGTNYLPDFTLPKFGLVEVKGAHLKKEIEGQRIYCAGKISKNDWRHQLADVRFNDASLDAHKTASIDGTPHSYGGPYFISCSHVSGHGPASHGVGIEHLIENTSDHNGPREVRGEVLSNCFYGIDMCDVFFAWIDTTDCYGTMVEIGYARARGKQIFIATKKGLDVSELWFAQECANSVGNDDRLKRSMNDDVPSRSHDGKTLYCSFCAQSQNQGRKLIAGPSVFICDKCIALCNEILTEECVNRPRHPQPVIEAKDPIEALQRLFERAGIGWSNSSEAEGKIAELARMQKKPKSCVVYGDPLEHDNYKRFGTKLKDAALRARQARFEHGEAP